MIWAAVSITDIAACVHIGFIEKNAIKCYIIDQNSLMADENQMFIKGSGGVSAHPKLHTYEEGYLLPVLSGGELLFSSRHKGLLRQIRDLSDLSSDDFDRTYGELMQQFMEFVQVLPHKPNGVLGSLLNYGLARATAVFQKYCQLRKQHTTPLFKFAVFSAALLKDIGRVVTNQRIVLVDAKGEYLSDWNPLSGSMIGQAEFYKMYQLPTMYLRIESEVTPLLARQLISRDAFLWLSDDLSVFSDWLAALLGQEGVGSKEITWSLALIKREDIIAILNTLDGATLDGQLPVATEHGEAFYRWLKEGLESGKITVNANGVFITADGVLLEKQLFKQFVDITKAPVNFTVVFTQFGNLMGIAKKGGGDFLHAQYFAQQESHGNYSTFTTDIAQKTRTMHEGMVVKQDHVFMKVADRTTSNLVSVKALVSSQHQKPISSSAIHTIQSNLQNRHH